VNEFLGVKMDKAKVTDMLGRLGKAPRGVGLGAQLLIGMLRPRPSCLSVDPFSSDCYNTFEELNV
jgi:hypothetical protein